MLMNLGISASQHGKISVWIGNIRFPLAHATARLGGTAGRIWFANRKRTGFAVEWGAPASNQEPRSYSQRLSQGYPFRSPVWR